MEKYTVIQNFETETSTDELHSKNFNTKKEAKKHFESIKNETMQGGSVETVIFNNKIGEEVESFIALKDYAEYYGKLVIAFQHVGKGMNYAHHFQELFWLDKYNEKNLSDNPDNRFKTWHYILDLKKEALNGLTFDEIFDKIKDEARLKLENYISLQGLDLEIKENDDEN